MPIPSTLAIDFGTKRVGLARSYGSLAEPLTVINNDQNLIAAIHKIVLEENLTQIVVGVSENEMAERSRAFGEQVGKRFGLPVFFMDETLSSKVVEQQLSELKQITPGRRPIVDHFAAATFLQEWLDTQTQI